MYLSDIFIALKLPFFRDRGLYRFCRKVLGFYPNNIGLYKLAFVHRSVRDRKSYRVFGGNNERMEWLGDSVLGAMVSDILYRHFPTAKEGQLTVTQSMVVKRAALNKIGRNLQLHEVMATGKGVQHNSYVYGNAVEALVAAVYLDFGYDRCYKFVKERIIDAYFDLDKLTNTDDNYKSRLVEWAQRNKVKAEFVEDSVEIDESNNTIFTITLNLAGICMGTARGYSKREAHQKLAEQALTKLKEDSDLCARIKALALLGTSETRIKMTD